MDSLQSVEGCDSITIHHLLTHTSGITSFTGFEDNLKAERLPTTVTATVLRFRDKLTRSGRAAEAG